MECIIVLYTILRYRHVEFKTYSFVFISVVIVIINIYKRHCYPDLHRHFRLNIVTNYDSVIVIMCSGRDERQVPSVKITELTR